ncbi:MAG: transcription termination factor NusA [Clostridia bacterium]
MGEEFLAALDMLAKEKGISRDYLLDSLKQALATSYKKQYGQNQVVKIEINEETGDIEVMKEVTIVEEVTDPSTQMSLAEAKAKWPEAEDGDTIDFPSTPKGFGRTGIVHVKNMIIQKIKEAEKANLYEEFKVKENDIMTGVIQRAERKFYKERDGEDASAKQRTDIFVDIGKAEAVMAENETVRGEQYTFGKRMKFYITEVKKTTKATIIRVSRSHPGLVRRLFELEAPEIKNGIVEIKNIAREAGSRTKIAVFSRDEDVDAIGSCVGTRGSRVQNVVSELNGEKIDIVKWSISVEEFISSALSPSKVIRVDIMDEGKAARVIVPDHMLSLAIGKDGQNARLAAKLTGWKIDIKSEAQFIEELDRHFLPDDDEIYDEDDFEDEEDDDLDSEAVAEEIVAEEEVAAEMAAIDPDDGDE